MSRVGSARAAQRGRVAQTLSARRSQHLLLGIEIGVALAVAVRVEHQRRPALRFLFVVRLVPHLRVQPAHHASASAAAGPQRVIGVAREYQVVRAEAGIDHRRFASSPDRTPRVAVPNVRPA